MHSFKSFNISCYDIKNDLKYLGLNIIKEANINGGMKKIYIPKKSNFKNIK